MLLENNTERVMNLVDIIDDLNGINKVRLAIHILEENYFSAEYDESFMRLLKEVLGILNQDYKKVITNFAKYKNVLFISAKYMELSLLKSF
jgi:glutaminase